ncbi:hypothetical protein [Roseimicrobium sp. ORNL1]|uniref:hypothetical protein n=1 Tax=Roseimicrobium sp. ORNL1 TaxID=2711231 RepID=UPI0013E1A4D1|nr:hypothetical protein [Roseimicrobium sp. ORNL1]QIF02778.1 hypothetical protein G5S37_15030 [Roseimicrobium sp. ORNL1]
MGAVSIVRSWALVVALWSCAVSVQGQVSFYKVNPVPSYTLGGAPTGYNYVVRTRMVGTNVLSAPTNIGSAPGSNGQMKTITTPAYTGPYELFVGYNLTNGSNFVPLQSWFSVPNGVGDSVVVGWPGVTTPILDYRETGPRKKLGTDKPVNEAGIVQEPPPTQKEGEHKVGFTLTNPGTEPKDFYIQPTDMNGNPIDDLPFQKVTLAPGESRQFSFSRPPSGSGGGGGGGSSGGPFKIDVIGTDWNVDPELGNIKSESHVGSWSSKPVMIPINNPPSSASQSNSSGGTIANQPAANQSQVSGGDGLTGSQANALNQNILNELQRLGAIANANASVAHSDAQQILGKLGSGTGTGGNMEGVEDGLDGVKESVDAVNDTLDGLKGTAIGNPTQAGPGQAVASGIATAEGDMSLLEGIDTSLEVMQTRIATVAAQLGSVVDAFPSASGSQSPDFTMQTAYFGNVHFQLTEYAEVFQLVRGGVLLVMVVYAFFTCIRLLKFAFV